MSFKTIVRVFLITTAIFLGVFLIDLAFNIRIHPVLTVVGFIAVFGLIYALSP